VAKKDRHYKVEVMMTGNPPAPSPVLKDNGKIIDPLVPIVFNKDTDRMKKVDHYRIRFSLDNPNHTNLRFVRNRDTLWVHTNIAQCPNSFCEMPGVIWVDEVDPQNGEWVDVINMDMVPQQFRFTLNLADKAIVNPGPADYVPLDPIGGNENRGSAGSGTESSLMISLGVGVLAGLASFAAATMLLAE
jgi:hypothetical protein